MIYLTLFASAFLAATLFPAQSEAVLAALIVQEPADVIALVAVATLGNVMGSVVNWGLGRCVSLLHHYSWFPFSAATLARAERQYRRYGRWSLLLSWVPIVGDPLTLVAGILRERLDVFILLVTLAKLARYTALALVVLAIWPES